MHLYQTTIQAVELTFMLSYINDTL